jgi:Zn finger protein HypA/HybF involved in hydrogenase expression
MRDNWYDVCEKRFGPSGLEVAQQVNAMVEILRTVRADQVKYYDHTLNEIKAAIGGSLAGTATAVNSAQTLEQLVTASSNPIYFGPNVDASSKCPKCGSIIRLPVSNDRCPKCGSPIRP